jgi:hypothetical protein
VKPHNDWFVSLDYNGAEVRTLLQLSGHQQPEVDIHEWNIKNLFDGEVDRDTAKTLFFGWLYNPEYTTPNQTRFKQNIIIVKKYLTNGTMGVILILHSTEKLKLMREGH